MKNVVIRIVTFFGIFLVLFLVITEIFKAKWINCYSNNMEPATLIVDGFYENKDKLDVVFVGSSNVYENINPLVLFEDYGISSYDFATASQTLSQTYSFTKEAIKIKKPKVIVLDVYGLMYNGNPREDRARRSIDNYPFSLNKLEFIKNIVTGIDIKAISDYIFPIKRYHSRWTELSKDDYIYPIGEKHYSYRGHQPHFNTVSCDDLNYNEEVEFDGFTNLSKEYFIKIIELCKETNTSLVLIKSPNVNWKKVNSDEVNEIIKPYDIKFLDYAKNYKEIGIDVKDCFRDTGRHMNCKGVKIYTDAIGAYLTSNYQLKDHRNEEKFSYIKDDLDIYYQDIESYKLSQMKDIKHILEVVNSNENYCLYYNVNQVDINKYNNKFYQLLIKKGINLTEVISGKNINCENINNLLLGNKGINIIIYDKLTKRVVDNLSVTENLVLEREKKVIRESDL